mmetsp:Transcript_12441/g.29418  ORF Transcript_12441/g.29418 Transcript_12441/m.29418 type:complete len:504 (+) Transcript_12441:125-1636(+)
MYQWYSIHCTLRCVRPQISRRPKMSSSNATKVSSAKSLDQSSSPATTWRCIRAGSSVRGGGGNSAAAAISSSASPCLIRMSSRRHCHSGFSLISSAWSAVFASDDGCFVTVALVESTEPLDEVEAEAEAGDDDTVVVGAAAVVLSWIAVSSSLDRSPPPPGKWSSAALLLACFSDIFDRMTAGGLSMLTGRVLIPTRENEYPLSSSSSVSESERGSYCCLRGLAPSLLCPAAVSPPMVVTELRLAAVKELVTDVWVLPVQSVDALLPSSSSSETIPPSSFPLPSSSEDGSLSLLSSRSKCRSVRFHDATARDRKAGVVDLLDADAPLVDDDNALLFLADLLLSEAILAPNDCFFFFFVVAVVLVPLLLPWGAFCAAILVGAKEESSLRTSGADFSASASSSSRAMEAYRLVLLVSFGAAPADPLRGGAPTDPVPLVLLAPATLEGTKVAARLALGPTTVVLAVPQEDLASRARARSKTDRGRPEGAVVSLVDVLMVGWLGEQE